MSVAKRLDVDRIVAMIEAEQKLIHGALVEGGACESPGHCAIGALLFAAGMDNETLRNVGVEPCAWSPTDAAAVKLYDAYGLRRRHAEQILVANDRRAFDAMDRRRARVVERVRELAAVQAADPRGDDIKCDEYDREKRR